MCTPNVVSNFWGAVQSIRVFESGTINADFSKKRIFTVFAGTTLPKFNNIILGTKMGLKNC